MSALSGLGYEIGRSDGRCGATGDLLEPGEPVVVALLEHPGEGRLRRVEFKETAWDAGARPECEDEERLFATWRTHRPDPNSTKDPLVDLGSLREVFESLAEAEDRRQQVFRYVLALLLMRKKKFEYLGKGDGVIRLRERGGEEPVSHDVVDPGMDDEAVAAAIEQISLVMSGDDV